MPPTCGVMYHSSPGTAAAIAGTAMAHSKILFIVRTSRLLKGSKDALQSVVQTQRSRSRHPTTLRTLGNYESSHCGRNAASVAGGGTAPEQAKKNPTPAARMLGCKEDESLEGQAVMQSAAQAAAASPMKPRSLPNAFDSICRIRSADTPYLSASSCSVALSSAIQRFCRMSRLRSSRRPNAFCKRSDESTSHSAFSTLSAGSESAAGR